MYIVNDNGFYFKVVENNGKTDFVDCEKLTKCRIYRNADEMYQFVCRKLNLDLDEVADYEILIRLTAMGDFEETDPRGCWHQVDLEKGGSLEDYISNYIL